MECQDGELRKERFGRTSAFSTHGQHVGLYKLALVAGIPTSTQEMKVSTSFVSLAVLVTLSTPAVSVALWGQCGVSIATPLLCSWIRYYYFRAKTTMAPLFAMRAQPAFTKILVRPPCFCKKNIIIIHSNHSKITHSALLSRRGLLAPPPPNQQRPLQLPPSRYPIQRRAALIQ